MNRKITIGVLALFLLPALVIAQAAVVPAGGDAASPTGSVSYSIGQVVYETRSSETGTSSEGVQQPFEIYLVTSTEEINAVSWNASVFPNPVSTELTLKVEPFSGEELHYQLLSLHGQVVLRGAVTNALTRIDMQHLASGTYLLSIAGSTAESFKIIVNR